LLQALADFQPRRAGHTVDEDLCLPAHTIPSDLDTNVM
jgi:hypothetical protein